jgi:hypothetical protein
MKRADVYVDLDGNEMALARLNPEERRLVGRLRRRARTHPDWTSFDNYWMRELVAFYDARGVRRSAMKERIPYRIAQDLSSRLGFAAGQIRPPDFLDELEGLILEEFPSRQAFAKATGMAETELDEVLAGRKSVSLETVEYALERIGYRLAIRPAVQAKDLQRPASRKGERVMSRAVGE